VAPGCPAGRELEQELEQELAPSSVGVMTGQTAPIPRLALCREEAAASLGMSLDSFERHVQPTLRLVRLGRMRLVPVRELERWLEQNANATLDGTA
jgi:hypothetical protein